MHPSAVTYTPFNLRLYDFFVLWFTNTFAWLCPTSTTLLPFFTQHVGTTSHLDVGVGTGYYLAHARRQGHLGTADVALVDLNPNSLASASKRLLGSGLAKERIQRTVHDVFTPIPEDMNEKYDSVSMFFLLHCLPGEMSAKAPAVFTNMAAALRRGGTLYGATVLGRGVQHNLIGRLLMKIYNATGIFGNDDDDAPQLKRALEEYLEEVEVRVVGTVALFAGKKPHTEVTIS